MKDKNTLSVTDVEKIMQQPLAEKKKIVAPNPYADVIDDSPVVIKTEVVKYVLPKGIEVKHPAGGGTGNPLIDYVAENLDKFTEERVCTKCHVTKPLNADNFQPYTKLKYGMSFGKTCRECINKDSKAWYDNWYLTASDVEKRNRAWKVANVRIGDRYFTCEDYENVYSKQHGLCKICDKPGEILLMSPVRGNRKNTYKYLAADHHHDTGQFRALLCYKCNLFIGSALEDITILSKAIEYLKLFNNSNVDTQ